MATYRELVGKKIKKVTSDPSDSINGQMWYNSTTGTIKGLALNEGWSSAPNLGTGAYLAGSFGTQTAGVKICGTKHPGVLVSNVEHYNGTGWSEETNYPAAGQSISGAGTQTAGIAAGGSTPSMTTAANSYDGTSWTSANSLPYAANNMASCGLTQSSVIYAVGRDGSSGNSGTNKSVTFDGTNFANGPNHVTTRMFNTVSGAGTGTAALIVGGFIDPSPNNMTNCEEYDGTSWSATGSLNVATGFASAWGTQTNAVTQNTASDSSGSEAYNGSTWSALPPTGAPSSGGLYGITAGATGDAGWLSAINPSGTVYNGTVEFNRSLNVVTGAAWASGGTMPQGTNMAAGCGTQTAGLGFAGYSDTYPGSPNDITESYEYDGSTWTAGGDVNTGRYALGGAGTQTAALAFGGVGSAPVGYTGSTEEYNGSSWTVNATPYFLNQARSNMAGAGTQTAAWAAGGYADPGTNYYANAETYNGTSWTAIPALNTARQSGRGGGTTTASLVAGGEPGTGAVAVVEEYNGSSWTTVTSIPLTAKNHAASGTQTDGLIYSGTLGGSTSAVTFGYDGTNWSTRPSMASARRQGASFVTAPASASTMFGGSSNNTGGTATEDFTGETETANVKTFSTS